jgi:hypothetical protein
MLPLNAASMYPTPVLVPYFDPSFALSQPVLMQSVPQPMRYTRAQNTGSPYARPPTTPQSPSYFSSQPQEQIPAPSSQLGLGSAIVYVGSDGQLTVALPQTDSQAPASFGYLPLNSASNSLPSCLPPPSSLRPPSSIAIAKAQSVSSTSSSSSGKTPNQPKKSVGRPIVKVAPLPPPSNIPLPNYPIPSTIPSTTPSPTSQSPYSATPVTPFTPATPATPITPAITPAMPPIPYHTEYNHPTIDFPFPEPDDLLLELPFIDYCP